MSVTDKDSKRKLHAQRLNEKIRMFIEEMSGRSNRPRNMEYYDKVLTELDGKRLEEIRGFKENGGKVFGTFCMFAPEELIYAAGAIPLRLFAGFQDVIRIAESILPKNLCPLVKSTSGLAMLRLGYYEICDALVHPITCDCKKKTCEILADYIPNTILITMELPQTTNTPQARRLWLTEIELLKKRIEEITNVKITREKLKDAINLVNAKRRVIRRLYELMKTEKPPISGGDVMYIVVTSFYDDIKRWTEKTEELCKELEEKLQNKNIVEPSNPRIMIAGCPIVPPNWKIPSLIENLGATIACDELCTGGRGHWDLVETCEWTMDDMLIALADRYLTIACACFTPNNNRIERMLNWMKEYKIDGVVYHVLHACQLYGVEAYQVKRALEKIGIPMLTIETDYSQDIGQIRTRVEAFLEIIKSRK